MAVQQQSSSLATALRYAELGWRVIPVHTPTAAGGCSCLAGTTCSKAGKHARIADWSNAASSDVDTVRGWFTNWPEANVALLLDGLAALDVDPKHDGFQALENLEAEHGIIEPRARQRSGSGGWHYLFAADPRMSISRGFRPGLDFLTGDGCYIVVAPSLHASGGRYKWTEVK